MMLDNAMPAMLSLLPEARRILTDGDTAERRVSNTELWWEKPLATLGTIVERGDEEMARVISLEIDMLSNFVRIRADQAIAFDGRRDLEAEAKEMLLVFWSILSLKATRLSEVGGRARLGKTKIGTPSALYALGWTNHAKQAAAAIEEMIQFSATLDRRKVISDQVSYERHPIGWLEILSMREVLGQTVAIGTTGDSSYVSAYEALATSWDTPDQQHFDEVFGAACDAYVNDCTTERERTDGSADVSKWLRPYGLEAFLRGRVEKGLAIPKLDHLVFAPAPSRDVRETAEVPDLPTQVTDALHLLDRLSGNILSEA